MVLVAAVALGSSTYAWFVASGTVTATGMKVQAQSEGGIVIRYDNGKWGTTATAGMNSATSLLPISTFDLAKWYHASAQYKDAPDAAQGTRQNFTDMIMNADGTVKDNTYVVMKEFQIASGSGSNIAKGLYVSGINVASKTKSMSTALRVGIKCKYNVGSESAPQYKTFYHIYAPVDLGEGDAKNHPSPSYTVYDETGAVVNTITGYPAYDYANSKLVEDTFEINSTTGVKVQIFIWYEGEDQNLYTNNYATEELSISVNFSAVSGGYATTPDAAQPVDLSGATTISGTATNAKASADAEGTTEYYAINGKKTADGKQLYTDGTSKDGLTSTSAIYIINGEGDDAVAERYNDVKLPAPTT